MNVRRPCLLYIKKTPAFSKDRAEVQLVCASLFSLPEEVPVRGTRAGILTPGSSYSPRLPVRHLMDSGSRAGFVPGYSGGTVTASLPSSLPGMSPRAYPRTRIFNCPATVLVAQPGGCVNLGKGVRLEAYRSPGASAEGDQERVCIGR